MKALSAVVAVLLGSGCSEGTDRQPAADGGPDAGGAPSGDAGDPCAREPAPADRVRYGVVSHPYTEGGAPATGWQVIALDEDGRLTATGDTFEMGRATGGRVAFTPDGAVGVAAQEDGTLGVFSLGAGGEVEVIEAGWRGTAWAGEVVAAPDGRGVLVLDSQWRENGGGVYRVDIDCQGRVTDAGMVAASRLPYALAFAGADQALVAASDILDSAGGADVHLVDLAAGAVIAGADPFPDDEQIVASAALTADGAYLLVGDNNQFYSDARLENRVAVVAIEDGALDALQTIPIEDPVAIAPSPFDDGALVVSGFGDALFRLSRAGGAEPFALAGEVDYQGPAPQLPGPALVVDRGGLRGRVLVAELSGVRQLAFAPGELTDLGLFSLGEGTAAITGALGLQP